MQPADLTRIAIPGDPRLHGDRVAYVVSRADADTDRYHRTIWIRDAAGARQLTAGPGDSSPRWSPDGSRIAFLRAVGDAKPQVAVIAVDGGEARILTDFPLGAEAVEWSPDGTRLAAVGVVWFDDWDGLTDDERKRRPRRITSVPYRFDGKGWLHDRRRALHLVDPSGEADDERLTDGIDVTGPCWSPDGRSIAFVTDLEPHRGLIPGADVAVVDLDTRTPRRLVPRGMWVDVSYRPDGAVHLVGHPEPVYPTIQGLHRLEDDGSLTALTAGLDRNLVSLAAGPSRIAWAGDVAHVGIEDAGSFGVMSVTADGIVRRLVDGERVVSGFDTDGDRLVFTAADPTGTAELFEAGSDRSLTSHRLDDLEAVMPDHFRVGEADVDVWVYLPEGDGPVPALLNIHGGPASQYGFGFFDEFQVYASAGFAVIACNPRGSSGRGLDFVRAVTGDGWGTVDVADVTAALEAALARHPRIDPERLGIMGGSYGGFLTAWMISRDHRFRSAVVERALLSFTSFAGTSDIGANFPRNYLDTDQPEAWDTWWEKSPLALAHAIDTPTLIVHSEEDHRCPIEQAEQLFMSLSKRGVPVEMLRFPGEGHELSRSGKPKHRLERFEAILEWHRRWLD